MTILNKQGTNTNGSAIRAIPATADVEVLGFVVDQKVVLINEANSTVTLSTSGQPAGATLYTFRRDFGDRSTEPIPFDSIKIGPGQFRNFYINTPTSFNLTIPALAARNSHGSAVDDRLGIYFVLGVGL